jgi:hypothetical protein
LGRYLITEKLSSGELTLIPDTSIDAIRERQGTEPMSAYSPRDRSAGALRQQVATRHYDHCPHQA